MCSSRKLSGFVPTSARAMNMDTEFTISFSKHFFVEPFEKANEEIKDSNKRQT